ncbi:MAG: metallophosphoesterase family protein [Patescibacteria group bacterium]
MVFLLLADLHSNLPALKAVFEEVTEFDKIFVCGDFVGYGPYPNGCIEKIAENEHLAVMG